MPVYVDMLIDYGWRMGPSCHLIADTEEELHLFASKIGMKRAWFQPGEMYALPHYDLTKDKRALAVRQGAVEINRKQLYERIETRRQSLKNKNKDNGAEPKQRELF